jgi:hypothetical protein
MTETPSPSPESVFNAAGGRTERIRQVHPPTLRDYLSIQAWSEKEIAEPERLLGDLVTRTSRAFLVGSTGIGKTMFGLALACGMATGAGFLHWRSARPARVLYIDGEMPAELIKARCIDAIRRLKRPNPPGNLCIFARDLEDEVAASYSTVGRAAPLNTPQGHEFVMALVEAIGGVDAVIFDNVMSLLAGDQREEVPWSDTIPLVERLTKARIGQVWLDHTGHKSTQQYGSSTKQWRFDSVAIMEAVTAGDRSQQELAFTLSFDAPAGKARRRTPANWQDFATCTVRLAEDAWTSEFADGGDGAAKASKPISREAKLFHDALLDALVRTDTPGTATRAAWTAEAIRRGLIDAPADADSPAIKDRKGAKMRKYRSVLLNAGWIGIDGEDVTNLKFGGQ